MAKNRARQPYDKFFIQATAFPKPYDYQRQLAIGKDLPEVLGIPTGVGKTAAIVLGWTYRRCFHPDAEIRRATPRRLVYCLPMRTLVEQTRDAACGWLEELAKHDDRLREHPISVHVLMGGAERTDWDEHPEREAILIGTQDMLLSRALNRGYGMNRYRWPMQFSLLNNDALWVFDETQLMGVGLTTSSQLQGLRDKLDVFGPVQSLWMSATLDTGRLATVDHPEPTEGWRRHELGPEDIADESVQRLIGAKKPCEQTKADVRLTSDSAKTGYGKALAAEIIESHQPGTLTLVVLNRVDRAQSVYSALEKQLAKESQDVERYLIHSRFRKCDRDVWQEKALDEGSLSPDGPGRIVIATQAIEAGVDLSATTLITELAPWPSLVQRFGRCNRRGTCGEDGTPKAQVLWIDIDTSDAKKARELALPYEPEELDAARGYLAVLQDVGPKSLESIEHVEPRRIDHTLRRKDLLELWDTTPDLAGNDLDVSRYIRDGDDVDVQIYWRKWDEKEDHGRPPSPKDEAGECVFANPVREELCAVSIGKAKHFLDQLRKRKVAKKSNAGEAWRWNPLEHAWESVSSHEVRPGMVLLLHVDAGGYDSMLGWTGDGKDRVEPIEPPEPTEPDAYGDDDLGTKPVLLTQHLRNVAVRAQEIEKQFDAELEGVPWNSILTAAEWHDVGKAHPAFQAVMHDSENVKSEDSRQEKLWAKSGEQGFPNYRVVETDSEGHSHDITRRGFRHELASALVWLNHADGEADADLIAFLIAAHHGKVRASLRSLPNERQPKDAKIRFARGLWDGDEIPPVDVGGGRVTSPVKVDLSLMELGEDEDGKPSWLARVLRLRDEYGPFRLAYMETLVRIADWRGSDEGGPSDG